MTNESMAPKTSLSVDLIQEKSSPLDENAPVRTPTSPSPLTTSLGGRVRKTTQVFTFTPIKSDEADEFSPPAGKGVKIRDIEYVRHNIEALGKTQSEIIKQLYSIMFGRRFQQKNCGEKRAAIAAKKAKQKATKRVKAAKKAAGEPAKKKRKTMKKGKRASEDEDDRAVTESEGEEESSDDSEEGKQKYSKRNTTSRSKRLYVEESESEDDGKEKDTKTEHVEKSETLVPAIPDDAVEEELDSGTRALDGDVCSKIRDIIANGNAEELTVKKIVQELSHQLGRDMSAQKRAIKEFITNDTTKVDPLTS
ncbi:hypothetical protein PsorP6_000808 [Peronosclerospora sorghi]|uniref:Uncharacterized protein n=1 Tax=Peronosclerospora sorghi TaxID=230839 RepID=A0ACC0WU73_9STRA|nr:hypothetical protein PsorP6_000808 [Peronosclerospora sorghi]